MNDQAKYTVTLEFETDGADAEINNLRKIQEAVDGVSCQGGMGEKSQLKLSKALESSGQAAGAAAGEVGKTARQQEIASQQTAIYNQYLYDQEKALSRSEESIISLRYANYDLARSLLGTSAAITAVGVASVAAFASQERAFTDVERIVDADSVAVGQLREELQKLSTEIPRSFQELSAIAAEGAAIGIDSSALDEFTDVVARFASLTGVTEEAAALGFGRISQYLKLTEQDYENLGSAILRAGNISEATEEQVLKFSQAISLPAARAGLLADEVVALGAATASWANINVEGAGSAFSRVFANIDRAVSEGGESLQAFADMSGLTADQFKVAWGSQAGNTFNRVIAGLSTNVSGLVGNLDQLGIRNERDRRIVSALALNYEDYTAVIRDTTGAWREGTYMQESYALVLDDIASKWQILLNALTNASAAVGSTVAPALAVLLDVATRVLVTFAEFAESPLGGTLLRTATLIAAIAASWLALRGVIALATASTLAFQLVTRSLGGIGILSGLRALGGSITAVGGASATAAGGVLILRRAIRGLLAATVIGGVLAYASEWMFNTGSAAQELGNTLIWLANIGTSVFSSIAQAAAETAPFIALIFAAMGMPSDLTRGIRAAGEGLRDWGAGLSKAQDDIYGLGDALGDAGIDLSEFEQGVDSGTDGLGGLGGAANKAAKEVRTLVDYSNDLQQVWGRAFEIRFSSQSTLDSISSSFITIREAADEAAKRIRDLNNDIRGLTSDIDIQEYFLSIAIEYGDTKRATAIEAELAKMRADLADKTSSLQKEQDTLNKSLVGNSSVAIENRKTITDLVQQYQAHIGALAASGASQAELAQATKRLRADFIQQATQLGFNSAELGLYAKAFDDVTVSIEKVPRNITVTANTNPAIQAFNEFKAATDRANSSVTGLRNNLGSFGSSIPKTLPGPQVSVPAPIPWKSWQAFMSFARENPFSTMLTKRGQQNWMAGIRQGFADGGFTGTGGKYEPAGVVHRGEYVIPKRDVNQATGLPYVDALGRLMGGIRGMASGGPTTGSGASSGTSTVALSAGSIQAIAQAVQPYLIVDGQELGQISSNAYSVSNSVGAN